MKNLLLRPYLAVAHPLRGKVVWDTKNPNPELFQPCTLTKLGLQVSAKAWDSEKPTLMEAEKKTLEPVDSSAAWAAYEKAYQKRYKVPPVRNAAQNAAMAQFVRRLGAEAPGVLEFYLALGGYYYSRGHSLFLAVKEAEKLRTEWASKNPITKHAVESSERRQETLRQIDRIEKGEL